MTPAARVAAAIEILDRVFEGEAAEKVLTGWARSHRYAGSKDRAAIRDHVFDALRRRRSYAALGGAETGRGIMIGALRATDIDPATIFTGAGYAPPPLTPEEQRAGRLPTDGPEALDCPDWLWPRVETALGDAVGPVFSLQRDPAPVGLRVNLARTSRDAVQTELAAAGIMTRPDPTSPAALVAEGRPRGLQSHQVWVEGRFELQDVGSQSVADAVPLAPGQTLLDYCAGGGGKTLAVAARVPEAVFIAHDSDPKRLAALAPRAARAGAAVRSVTDAHTLPVANTVLVDAPCSGSGTWRRAPEAKWRLTPERLAALTDLQADILERACKLVSNRGHLVYATCAILPEENQAQIARFLSRDTTFALVFEQILLPSLSSDGFYVAVLQKSDTKGALSGMTR